ncbi:MAG: apolipoprotein N-acyltransferase [Acidimicrobiales bacterium]
MRSRRGGVAVPSLAAGVLLALSVPPFGAWPSAFVGAALLYWRLRGLRLRARLLAGWLAGIGCFAIGLFWAENFNWYGAVALVLVESLFMAVAAGLTPPGPGRLVAFVGAYSLLEWARMSWPFGGLPIGGVFLGQAGGPLLPTARLGGPLLLTALVWLGGAALGELGVVVASARGSSARHRPWAGIVALGLVVVVAILGVVAPDGGPTTRSVRVAAVQGGGRRGLTELETGQAGDFSAQLDATAALGDPHRPPALIVWPEDVVALTEPLAETEQAVTLARLARSRRATLLAGVTVTEPHDTFRNEIVAWGPDGHIVSVFEKVHRVPFGEYVPLRGVFSHLANLAAVPRDAIAGHGSGLMKTPAGPLGVLVSYEVFFADRGRSSVRAGARLLVVPTNTASYGTDQVPSQEVAADRVQAVEEGRNLVQCAPTGYSDFVTNRGQVLERSALSARQVLVTQAPMRTGATLYERFGDLPTLVLAALGLAVGLALARVGRKSTTEPGPGRADQPSAVSLLDG